ncbi:lymphocyte antigen 6H-like isoform X1 [Dromiciops gliroides]|uniref:lymphocyte antigen 6H-like isoform X1 n=2 Tax=Dromiciops gliroides TaxID=33562 RepID=UPI001CC6A653|nr:lymphocyte antigen 6H-like isoform X1 [Dromiciops gliroides]
MKGTPQQWWRQQRTMEILLYVLLGTLLFVESAHCLQCLSCAGVNDLSSCRPKTCTAEETICAKAVLTSQLGPPVKTYTMNCATSCDEVKETVLEIIPQGFSGDVSCCNTDLCNGVGGIRGSPWALAGALILSLIPALLWAGL